MTSLGTEPSRRDLDSLEEGLWISVRTLLPLARLLAALRPLIEENGDDGARSFDTTSPRPGPRTPDATSAVPTSVDGTVDRGAKPSRVDRCRHGRAHEGERSGGAE